MKMPEPDKAVIERRTQIISSLMKFVPNGSIISEKKELSVYESDGLTAYQQVPMIVVLPETVEQISQVLSYC